MRLRKCGKPKNKKLPVRQLWGLSKRCGQEFAAVFVSSPLDLAGDWALRTLPGATRLVFLKAAYLVPVLSAGNLFLAVFAINGSPI